MALSKSEVDQLVASKKDAYEKAQALITRAEGFNRDLSATEAEEVRVLTNRMDYSTRALESEVRAQAVEDSFAKLMAQPRVRPVNNVKDPALDALRSMILERNPAPVMAGLDEVVRSHYNPGIEARALSTTAPASFSPVSFYSSIVENLVDSASVMAAGATVVQTPTGETLRIPRQTALSTASLIAEGAAITASDPTLSSVSLGAYKYAILVSVSNELVKDSGVDLGEYLARETGTALGLALGNAFVNGTGTAQPRGFLADAGVGVTGPVGTATSFGAQGTAGQGTDLLNSLYASVAEPYTRSKAAGFLARNASLAAIRNLKATTGTLVGNDFLANSPAPYWADAYMPALAASAKSVAFGDWSRYFVRIVQGIRFEASTDFAFGSDTTTFRAIIRADGALINTDAIKVFVNSAT